MPDVTNLSHEQAYNVRPARLTDCAEIARLILIASEGLGEYLWSPMAAPGESVLAVGARRFAQESGSCSYQNCFMAEQQSLIIGLLHVFLMEIASTSTERTINPVLRPFADLKDCGSLYISALVVDPAHRGRGVGTRLLNIAEARARSLGQSRLSMIGLEHNERATRLYQRLGFRETDRRPLVRHPAVPHWRGDAVLLVRPVAPVTR